MCIIKAKSPIKEICNIFHEKTLAKKNLADPKNRQMEWMKLVCQNREWIDIHGYPR